jgi:DUF2075 family protein
VDEETWGWAGSAHEFLTTPRDVLLSRLSAHLVRLLDKNPSSTQLGAWRDEHMILAETLQTCITVDADAPNWSVIFEYELPLEGGRRPDVVVLAGESIIVLEFKTSGTIRAGDLDQTRAYAQDLADYHKASHGRRVNPILVLTGAKGDARAEEDGTIVVGPDALARYLVGLATEGGIDRQAWLGSPYEPLPTLVAAAKRIFQHEPLPHVWTALAAGIPQALEYLVSTCRRSETSNERALAFVTGVPGAGKTLVGLRLVYEGSTMEGRAAFLSGNGPLVDVLQYALQSRVFVRDLHKAILDYGRRGRTPREHIIVFDEAQRAWDRNHMERERGVAASEPELLMRAGERVADWAVLVGLVGEGQEIYAGEEAGIEQWNDAVANGTGWKIHCPEKLRSVFSGQDVATNEFLDLKVSLRSRRADMLHDWVYSLLAGDLKSAARKGAQVHASNFPMYLTRDLAEAKEYARWRYTDEPDGRYGLVASSHAKVLPKFGVDNSYLATRKVKYGPWYSAPRDDPKSCCQCEELVTEFGCQGLELDLPIVCWGEDHRWTGTDWQLKPIRRKKPVDDPEQLLQNAYRVLLTRGRDGFVIYLPDAPELDLTEQALLAAGVRLLPQPVALPASVSGGAA